MRRVMGCVRVGLFKFGRVKKEIGWAENLPNKEEAEKWRRVVVFAWEFFLTSKIKFNLLFMLEK